MRRDAGLRLPMLVGLSIALGACATLARPPSPEELVARHKQRAEALEREGNLRRALDEWRIAVTINPDDAAARARKKAVEGWIEQAVADRIGRGREALRRDAHLEARRHFLAALALDPFNRVAFEALRSGVKEIRYVTHRVRPGETLVAIAERYYCDRSRAELIAESNQLPANPRLVVGATLRIPEIPGIPFVHPEACEQAPPEDVAASNPFLLDAREYFDKGEYTAALADVDKVLAGEPRHAEGIELKKAILYGMGKSQLNQRKYQESYQTLSQLAKLARDYEDAASLILRARDGLIQEHYAQGLRLFREEKLAEAIAEWRLVLEYDPQHANALKNIEQAERLLKGLEERQQPRRPPAPK